MIEKENGPEPIFVAGGGAANTEDPNYAKASLRQNGKGNDRIGSSGVQSFFPKAQNDFYCAGAGFHEGPIVGELVANSVPPQSYAKGLKGGKAKDCYGRLREGGFGGGGAYYYRNGKDYHGAGGGFTGGSTKIRDGSSKYCDGGGGGSFSIDQNAKFDHFYVEYGKCKIEFLN